MIDHNRMLVGISSVDRYHGAMNSPKPFAPSYAMPNNAANQAAFPFDDAHSLMDIPVYAAMFQTTMEEILSSDHPMLVDAVRKLYALGKLCLPADNARIELTQHNIHRYEKHNEDTKIENERKSREFLAARENYEAAIAEAAKYACEQWDEFVVNLEKSINRTKTHDDLDVWSKIAIQAIEASYTKESITVWNLNPRWQHKRPIDLRNLKTDEWSKIQPLPNILINQIRAIFLAMSAFHKIWIETQRNDLYSEIRKSPEVKAEAQRIKKEFDHAVKFHKRASAWVSSSDVYGKSYSPYRQGWDTTTQSEYNRYLEEKYADELRLEHKIDIMADRMMKQRHAAGEDGYDEIYSKLTDKTEEKLDEWNLNYYDDHNYGKTY